MGHESSMDGGGPVVSGRRGDGEERLRDAGIGLGSVSIGVKILGCWNGAEILGWNREAGMLGCMNELLGW